MKCAEINSSVSSSDKASVNPSSTSTTSITPPSTSDHELTLFIYPSPGISWRSPATLTLTSATFKLTRQPRAIGHVTIMLKSVGSPNLSFHAGMTQLNRDEGQSEVLQKGYGLSILSYDFQGRLETQEELASELQTRAQKTGKLSYLRFEINREIAERIHRYYIEYQEKGAHLHYGGPHRPLHAEGAGCGAFAASFLEVSNILDPQIMQTWNRKRRIPHSLLGGPKTKKFVSVLRLITSSKWASEQEPHQEISIWDPDLMHDWVLKNWKDAKPTSLEKSRLEKWEAAHGLVIDAKENPCPDGPIFKGTPDFSQML